MATRCFSLSVIKNLPFLKFSSSYTIHFHPVRELFGRFLKNGFQCTLNAPGHGNYAHTNKPIKGFRQLPHPLNAKMRHGLALKGSEPMPPSCTAIALRPFASGQPGDDMKTDGLFARLETIKISPGSQLDYTSAQRTPVSAQKKPTVVSVK